MDSENQDVPDAKERPQDELRVGPIVLTGIVGAIVIFAMIVGLSALFAGRHSDEAATKWDGGPSPELQLLRSEQLEKLSEYRRVPDSEVVRLPIGRAMEIIVKELGGAGK